MHIRRVFQAIYPLDISIFTIYATDLGTGETVEVTRKRFSRCTIRVVIFDLTD